MVDSKMKNTEEGDSEMEKKEAYLRTLLHTEYCINWSDSP